MTSSNPPGSGDDPREKPGEPGGWSADSVSGPDQAPQAEPFDDQEEPKPKKKRYYSPNEVMKKKGCIGCGGMGVLLALLTSLMAALVALL